MVYKYPFILCGPILAITLCVPDNKLHIIAEFYVISTEKSWCVIHFIIMNTIIYFSGFTKIEKKCNLNNINNEKYKNYK